MYPIYKPAEDSFLMQKILRENLPKLLEKNHNLKFLEIGTGSGIHLETAKNLGVKEENIFSSDINPKSVRYCNLLGFNCIQSDLFEAFKGGGSVGGTLVPLKFDLIIFNPPYLPEDKREPCDSVISTTGGKTGCEIINKFLIETKNYLNKNGKIFLITSSLTKGINFQDYKKVLLGSERLFMEELFVWEVGI